MTRSPRICGYGFVMSCEGYKNTSVICSESSRSGRNKILTTLCRDTRISNVLRWFAHMNVKVFADYFLAYTLESLATQLRHGLRRRLGAAL